MVYGGVFKVLDMNLTQGNPRDPETKKYYDVMAWGMVSRDAETVIREADKQPKANFGLRFKKHHFMNCTVFPDNPHVFEIAQKLKEGDMVVVWGRTKEWTYKVPHGRKDAGAVRTMYETRAHAILPMRMVGAFMEVLKDDDAPDTLASLNDYIEQMDGIEIPW